jgi:hypothetical protein
MSGSVITSAEVIQFMKFISLGCEKYSQFANEDDVSALQVICFGAMWQFVIETMPSDAVAAYQAIVDQVIKDIKLSGLAIGAVTPIKAQA